MPLSLSAGLTLYFCRHGETEANVQKRMQGRTIDTALTARGHEQARAVADILKHNEQCPRRLDFVASPLKRARTTMELIRGTLGLPPEHYTRDDRLIELNLGVWDGLHDDEARARDPAAFDHRANDKWNIRIPGGESYADVAQRAQSWIADLKADTFVVSHGGFTRILRGLFDDLSWQEMSALDEPQRVVFRVQGNMIERLTA